VIPNSISASASTQFNALISVFSDKMDANPLRHMAQESSKWTSFADNVGSCSIVNRMRSIVVIWALVSSPSTLFMAERWESPVRRARFVETRRDLVAVYVPKSRTLTCLLIQRFIKYSVLAQRAKALRALAKGFEIF